MAMKRKIMVPVNASSEETAVAVAEATRPDVSENPEVMNLAHKIAAFRKAKADQEAAEATIKEYRAWLYEHREKFGTKQVNSDGKEFFLLSAGSESVVICDKNRPTFIPDAAMALLESLKLVVIDAEGRIVKYEGCKLVPDKDKIEELFLGDKITEEQFNALFDESPYFEVR